MSRGIKPSPLREMSEILRAQTAAFQKAYELRAEAYRVLAVAEKDTLAAQGYRLLAQAEQAMADVQGEVLGAMAVSQASGGFAS